MHATESKEIETVVQDASLLTHLKTFGVKASPILDKRFSKDQTLLMLLHLPPSVEVLYVDGACDSADDLLEGLLLNKKSNLVTLSIRNCPFSSSDTQLLLDVIRMNKGLKDLDIDALPCSETAEKLKELEHPTLRNFILPKKRKGVVDLSLAVCRRSLCKDEVVHLGSLVNCSDRVRNEFFDSIGSINKTVVYPGGEVIQIEGTLRRFLSMFKPTSLASCVGVDARSRRNVWASHFRRGYFLWSDDDLLFKEKRGGGGGGCIYEEWAATAPTRHIMRVLINSMLLPEDHPLKRFLRLDGDNSLCTNIVRLVCGMDNPPNGVQVGHGER
jgi:hypothetical protein